MRFLVSGFLGFTPITQTLYNARPSYTRAAMIGILAPTALSSVPRPSGCNLINDVGRSLTGSARSAGTSTTAFRSLACIVVTSASHWQARWSLHKWQTPEGTVSWLNDGIAWAWPIGKLPTHAKKFWNTLEIILLELSWYASPALV